MGKCPICKKDFEKGVKNAFRLGRIRGREEANRTLQIAVNTLQQAFGHLFNEIKSCDKKNPIDGDPNNIHFTIRKVILKKYIKQIRKRHSTIAAYFTKILKEHEREQQEAYKRIITELENRR